MPGLDAVPPASTPIMLTRRIVEERDGTGPSRWSRRRRRRPACRAAGPRPRCICARVSSPITHLEIAHHRRIGVRAGDRADQVDTCRRHCATQSRSASFIASFSVAVPEVHRPHLGAQQLHAEDVGLLPLDVGRAHVDDAGQVEERADGGGGDAVLAGAGLGDDAALAHAARQQDLAERVVDLVRAGVVEVLALQIDLRAAEMARSGARRNRAGCGRPT